MEEIGSINPALYQSVDGDDDAQFPEEHIGRLWFQLAYERESEKLIVTLVKAKHLPCRPDKSPGDPFVRYYTDTQCSCISTPGLVFYFAGHSIIFPLTSAKRIIIFEQ